MGAHSLGRGVLRLAVALTLTSGCATLTVPVPGVTPGPVSLGDARTLVLAGGKARRDARKALYRELQTQAQRRGYFHVVDRTRDGWRLELEEDGGRLEGASVQLRRRSVAVRLDVPVWSQAPPTASTQQARVRVAISIANASGALSLRQRLYEGRGEVLVGLTPDNPGAVERVISAFLDDVTPIEVLRDVALDDSDAGQQRALLTAVNGNVARAHEELRVYLERDPENAAAAYNLGVLTEALGRYEEALALYDRALELDDVSLYRSARAACARSADAAVLTTE